MKIVNGWIVLDVCDHAIAWAQELFAERLKAGVPNCFDPAPGVLPWIGDLAEIYFDRWMQEERLPGYVWHRGEPFRKQDFTMPTGRTVDVMANRVCNALGGAWAAVMYGVGAGFIFVGLACWRAASRRLPADW